MQKFLVYSFLILTLGGIAAAQEIKKDERQVKKMPGKLKGEIIIKEAGGNNLGNFSCANLVVSANRIDAKRPLDWKRQGAATGDFSKRRCSFLISDIPAIGTFVAVISANFPKGCDLKTFDATTSFPMQLKKGGEVLKYDFTVTKIRCEIVK
ncbi:hypothetical protein BH20ACI4_BH20ACI4_05990 [soil metagenome]